MPPDRGPAGVAGISPSLRKVGTEPKRAEVEGVATLARFLPENWADVIWPIEHKEIATKMIKGKILDFMKVNMIYTSLRYFKILKRFRCYSYCLQRLFFLQFIDPRFRG